jgi:dolichol-phosphate mannosyltransferase
MRAIVLIPTYNERTNLAELVAKIREVAPALHMLIVDDNSPDGTGELADELARRDPERLFVLHRQKKEGLGRAYVAAFTQVLTQDYEYILQMDADLSHDPLYLPRFFEAIHDHDLVIGSRYLQGISVVNWDLKRLVLSKLASHYVRFITRMPLTDPTSGFICWRRAALESIGYRDTFSIGYVFLVEMKYKAYREGLRFAETPIIFVERKHGNSKLGWRVAWEAFWSVVRLKFKY